MIQQEYKNNVKEVSSQVKTTGFNIEVNESMFQMLTSNIYNDPMLAVIREWSTNACDACIAANKPVDFFVHLPTPENPTFYVRDYGTGLAPENIEGLFSNLGASTKRDSNDFNGTLGIGRMAGLAVADAFTVESYYEGTHYSYVISMQNGIPVTLHMGNTVTQESNGLKLSIAVSRDDIFKYEEKAVELYKYFDHKPTTNKTDLNFDLEVSSVSSDEWYIKKSTSRYNRDNYVVMSQIAYKIGTNSAIEDHGFSNAVIKAPPGAVTFNPGRESLSLDKKTIEYVNKKFNQIKEEYTHEAILAMAATENDIKLYEKYQELVDKAPHGIGKDLCIEAFASKAYTSLFMEQNPSFYFYNGNKFQRLQENTAFYSYTNSTIAGYYKESNHVNSKSLSNTVVGASKFFSASHVIVDVKSNYIEALKHAYENKTMVKWQRYDKSTDLLVAVQTAKDFLSEMGISYVLASTLVEVYEKEAPKEEKKVRLAENTYISSVDKAGNVYNSAYTSKEEIETGTFLYLKLSNTTPVIKNTSLSFYDYINIYTLLKSVCKDTVIPKIKGVAKKYQHVVNDLDNWIDFETYIEEKVKNTTIRVPSPVVLPRVSAKYINSETCKDFPVAVQDYYTEIRDYREFMNSDQFVRDYTLVELFKTFGGSTINYQPTKDVDMEYLETVYGKTMLLIHEPYSLEQLPDTFLLDIAKLEENYAIHKT
jgi:hypothetical protein